MIDNNHTPQKLYTVNQLVEILQITKNHIYIMCRRGDIPYINIGRGKNRIYRFDVEKVKKFLESRQARGNRG